jgi:hypothetical protein
MWPGVATDFFEIQNVADGVRYASHGRSHAEICNAAIFVNSADVLEVHVHSKPSAAAGLIAQINQSF